MAVLLGIDTGGTYTDAVLFDEERGVVASAKALTTRHDLAVGIDGAVGAVLDEATVSPGDVALVSLSTTLATNALVEGQGGRICLVLVGFGEEALARAGLAEALKDDPVIYVNGGHDAHGNARAPLDIAALEDALAAVADTVTGFAVAGQFAVRNPKHETAVRDAIIARTAKPVTCSHELSSKLDGPRRALTCVLNARLINLIWHLIDAAERLFSTRGIDAPVMVVRGDGALIAADVARVKPIETILSGPAASLVGASYLTGASDAMVSDIGGTTTDFAVLRGGLPALDENGATVGGWRTMVEAVDMQTVGLGGDSEVSVRSDGLGVLLDLGPRRLVPLSLLATDYPALVHETLDIQLRQPRRSDLDGRFAIAVGRRDAAAPDGAEAELLARLDDGPAALSRLVRNRAQASVLNRLVARGHVLVSGMTPSDAAHVLGRHDGWDVDAARKGAGLFARHKTSLGTPIAAGAHEISQAILDRLVELSARTLFGAALREDGLSDTGFADRLFGTVRNRPAAVVTDISAKLAIPVVGLGASAPTYYPDVAGQLGTQALIPEHAGVANAVGAVVGQVRVTVSASIVQPQEGLFRVHAGAAPQDFHSLDDAVSAAEETLRAQARGRALSAGADEVTVKVSRNDRTATVEGKDVLIESLVAATATGRPRIAVQA